MTTRHPPRTLEALALVAVGGLAGAELRYLLAGLLPPLVGTLAVNTLGSFLLGLLLYAGLYAGTVSPETRSVLATGFLASFTTYSTFALETANVAEPALAVANVVAAYGFGLAGVLVGRSLARRLVGGSRP